MRGRSPIAQEERASDEARRRMRRWMRNGVQMVHLFPAVVGFIRTSGDFSPHSGSLVAELARYASCESSSQEASMRPRALMTALVIALPLVAAPVARAQNNDDQEQRRNSQSRETTRFQGMDRNNDGVITRRDWRGSAASFRPHDGKGDSVLAGAEVRAGAARPDTSEGTPPYDWTQAGFERIDTNRDG